MESELAFKIAAICGAGHGQFTAALEVQQQERLVMSFLHHMAVQRLCKNPLEDEDVVGITNYIDIGLQVCARQMLC